MSKIVLLSTHVIPAQAGIQSHTLSIYRAALDSRLRGNDELCGVAKGHRP